MIANLSAIALSVQCLWHGSQFDVLNRQGEGGLCRKSGSRLSRYGGSRRGVPTLDDSPSRGSILRCQQRRSTIQESESYAATSSSQQAEIDSMKAKLRALEH